jgi:hypothetical protein
MSAARFNCAACGGKGWLKRDGWPAVCGGCVAAAHAAKTHEAAQRKVAAAQAKREARCAPRQELPL